MNRLYTLLLAVAVMITGGSASAQQAGTLKGKLQDDTGVPVAYANVAVLDAADASLASGAVTDAAGNFSITTPAAGAYLLRISAIGFVEEKTPVFEVEDSAVSKDFGILILKEEVETLNEVTVQALRPTIVQEADRMVVSVEGTALAAGNTAFDVLAKSPGIWVDQEGNIQLNGQAGVRVMIDGRATYLSAKELQTMLEGMSAENIKNIEIISNPSARYDAEGTSGIININLKKNTLSGINGSVYTGYQYNGLGSYTGGATINHKKGSWNSFATLDVSRRARFRDGEFFREFNTETAQTNFDQDAYEEVYRFVPALRFGTDYDINSRHSIGAVASLSYQEASYDFQTNTDITSSIAGNNLFIDANNYTDSEYKNATANLHYLGRLDTLGSTLSADLDVVRIEDKGSARFENFYNWESSTLTDFRELLTSENPSSYDIYSLKLDYARVLKNKRRLEVGVKGSRVISDNDLRFYTHTGETGPEPDPGRSSHFVYEENIYAAYANFSTALGKKLSLQVGLRAEQTEAEGFSITKNEASPREYLDLFPSLFLQHTVSENYQVNYNYSRRINRPDYELLNPFVFYLDPKTWAQGNPYLRPAYTHSFGITQLFKQTYTLVLEYAETEDFFTEVPELNDETQITVFGKSNVDTKNASATLVAPVKIMKHWEANNNATFAYQEFTVFTPVDTLLNTAFFYMAQSTHNILLPEKFRLEVSGAYQGPLAHGLYQIKGQWWVDLGVKRSFMNDKLDVSLNVTDIFKSRWVRGTANVGDDLNGFKQYFSARGVGINLRYRFSRGEKFEVRRRNTNLEELNRAGGN